MTIRRRFYIAPEQTSDLKNIKTIGEAAMQGGVVGFLVSDNRQAELYCGRLKIDFPEIRVLGRSVGPAMTVLVRVMKESEMTKCPTCGDSVPDLEQHLERAHAPKDPNAPMKYKDRDGRWHPIARKEER